MQSQVARCSKCGVENTSGHRFCVSCGAPLVGTYSLVSSSKSGRFVLSRLLPDGAADLFPLGRETVIGREGADVTIGDDPFLSSRHAIVADVSGRFVLRDLGSRNGTYVKIRGEVELRPGDCLMVGGQVFRLVA
jgi:pSer/pThr/pTyr-binding forkhead associated (FHA) protein